MSETKWTPGPWEWQELMPEDKDWGMCEITASDDNFVCTAVIGVDNARLISAAPDMAEALKELMSEIDRHGKLGDRGHDDDDVWLGDASGVVRTGAVRRARTALAKARGET